jgi:tetratricopeptide (TPR) repeat protein
MSPRKKQETDALKRYLREASRNLNRKKFKNAVKNCNQALKLNPNCAEAYFSRGEAYSQLKDFNNALQDFNKALQIKPDFDHALIHRSFVYKYLGEYDQALADLRKVKDLISGQEGKLTYAFNAGTIFALQGKYEKALRLFSQSLKLTKDNSDRLKTLWSIGKVYSSLGKHDKALDNLNHALDLKPDDAELHMYRGIEYEALNQNEKALEDFEKASALDPKNLICQINRGIFYRIIGRYEQALGILRYAIELEPKREEGYFQLGYTYEMVKQYDRALDQYEKALSLDPKDAHTYVHVGMVQGRLKDETKAIQSFTQAIKLEPKNVSAFLDRGISYSCMNDYVHALKDFTKSLEIDPSIAEAYLGKGKALCFLMKEKISFKTKKKHENAMLRAFEKASTIAQVAETRELANWWIRFSKKYCDSSSENKRRLEVFANLYEDSLDVGLFSTIIDEQNRFSKLMNSSKTITSSECYFQVLRRWNSFTPAIPERSRSNLGGGYILVSDRQGTVIDPGYNFIENFAQRGFSLGDVDNIVLTHAHDDHTADFEAILSLLRKLKANKKINLFANLGASVKFSNLIAKNESAIGKVEILNENRKYQLTPRSKMEATRAKHKDILTEESTKGLIFEVESGARSYKVGLTSDTAFFITTGDEKGLSTIFENMDVLIFHIGSMQKQEFECLEDNFESHKYEGEHLGIRGVLNLILQCRPKLAIISEFGEELRELRTMIAGEIDNRFENFDSTGTVRVIPGDIGLKILFDDEIKVECEVCGNPVKIGKIRYTETMINHKIAYHCENHQRREIIDKFRAQEEKELRTRAENVGCSLDSGFRVPPLDSYGSKATK